jgi:orotidine-5'-phosphate decarboxylase
VNASRVIVALDVPSPEEAWGIASKLKPDACRLKVGKELFVAAGPGLIERLAAAGFEVFLDLKFHDIPNTVASACRAAARLGVWMLDVHALGGREMLQAAREGIEASPHKPLLVAVTVLTSMSESQLREVGIASTPMHAVGNLAALVSQSGLDGVVCSAQEAAMLRSRFDAQFKLVTPGIRPAGSSTDDQHRITTPAQAIVSGVDYLVIGRPITRAADPQAALEAINAEIDGVLKA